MTHTAKGFGIINKAEIDVFLELPCFFYDPADVGNLISGFSAFSKSHCLLNLYADYIMQEPGLDESQAGIKIAGRNANNLRYADDWRRKWKPTPLFLPGESHGQRSLEGYSPWGHKTRLSD